MMQMTGEKNTIVQQLKKEILSLQGFKEPLCAQPAGLLPEPIEKAFPNQRFPTGAVHEFISTNPASAAATNGFIAGILGKLMQTKSICLWIGHKPAIFPPALTVFGISPERIIFATISNKKEALWAVEEALKCEALAAVVGELSELGFKESRRLQLAVEQSGVTGFIHRFNPNTENTVACITRWKIKPLPGSIEDAPGVGFPEWEVNLLKVRNGKPGLWQVQWSNGGFQYIPPHTFSIPHIQTRKAG